MNGPSRTYDTTFAQLWREHVAESNIYEQCLTALLNRLTQAGDRQPFDSNGIRPSVPLFASVVSFSIGIAMPSATAPLGLPWGAWTSSSPSLHASLPTGGADPDAHVIGLPAWGDMLDGLDAWVQMQDNQRLDELPRHEQRQVAMRCWGGRGGGVGGGGEERARN